MNSRMNIIVLIVNKYMKYGIIYGTWAIIFELEESDGINGYMRKSGIYYFLKDWNKKINGKDISQKFLISDKKHFIKQLSHFKNDLNDLEKTSWEIEISKINDFQLYKELNYYPLVSVILASYNSSNTIEKSVRTIIKQNYKNIELIVIDDCSTDNNYNKLIQLKEKYQDRITKFKVIQNDLNKGAYYSRNRGINHSTGSIIAIQDADDLSDLNRLIISVYELITSEVEFVLSNGPKLEKIGDINPVKIAMASLVVRRDFFDKYGMYDDNTRHSGDLEILDRAYFMKYGNYEFENFWYWLNYTMYKEEFYKHIYENLYYVIEEKNSITSNYNINKRMQYLNERRKIMRNKM